MRWLLRFFFVLLGCWQTNCFLVRTTIAVSSGGYSNSNCETRMRSRHGYAKPIGATNGRSSGGIETETPAEGVAAGGGGIDIEPPPLYILVSGLEDALDLLGSSTQWVVAGSVGAALVTRADADTLVWVVGSLFNAAFSKILKKSINQVRPDGSQLKDPGMPSSHAMSLFFLGTYLVIALQQYGVTGWLGPPWPLDAAETQALIALYAITASLWRVKAGFHTLPQVSVGAVVGALDATLWYYCARVYFMQQVEEVFGGPEVPLGVSVSICLVTFFTFGNVRRRMGKILGAQDGVDRTEL